MPIALDADGQISALAIGVEKGTFSAQKGGTGISVTRAANAGIFSFSGAQSIPAGTFEYLRLEGTPLPDTNTIVASVQLSGKKTGPDSSAISFAVNGVDKKGWIKVSVYVDGHLAMSKTITIDGDVAPAPSIAVTAPNGGETWQRGTSHTVTWDYTGSRDRP